MIKSPPSTFVTGLFVVASVSPSLRPVRARGGHKEKSPSKSSLAVPSPRLFMNASSASRNCQEGKERVAVSTSRHYKILLSACTSSSASSSSSIKSSFWSISSSELPQPLLSSEPAPIRSPSGPTHVPSAPSDAEKTSSSGLIPQSDVSPGQRSVHVVSV